ncbi:hypothetical protein [Streptomyces yangpuensis]
MSTAVLASGGLYLMESFPVDSNTWRATMRNATGSPITVTVWAVCVDGT